MQQFPYHTADEQPSVFTNGSNAVLNTAESAEKVYTRMEKIEAVELLNTHFFSDTTILREAWYTIRAALAESTNSSHNRQGTPRLFYRKYEYDHCCDYPQMCEW